MVTTTSTPHTTLTDNSDTVLSALDALLSNIEDKIGFDMERRTKENIVTMDAVDTGNMLGTTHYDPRSRRVYMPAPYTERVHNGYMLADGRHVAGRPFFAKALLDTAHDIPASLNPRIEWGEAYQA
jgi:hypothetical protein